MTSPQISLLLRAIKTIGAKLPKPVTQALADRDTITKAAAGLRAPTPDMIAQAVAAAILAGTDPTEDAEVRRLTNLRTLAGSGTLDYTLGQEADRRITVAITAHADEMVTILKDAADAAGKVLTDAHKVIGDLELTDSEQILNQGTAAASAWVAAKNALETIREADQAWFQLAELARFTSSSIAPVLRIAALDLDTFEKVGRNADAWTIVREGGTISLATRTSARERTTNITDAIQARQDFNAGAVSREYRRTHSINR